MLLMEKLSRSWRRGEASAACADVFSSLPSNHLACFHSSFMNITPVIKATPFTADFLPMSVVFR